jgi:UDP-3-O-[3-hydroxymyristoyl] N-acetylglucosamine deacetylase/3-hydroxyacyl-[acyl-carrier-protein] dehydratase
MPAVLQLEAMAQAAGLLMLRHVAADGRVAYFMSCDKAKFRVPVTPGDQLTIHAKITKMRGQRIAAAACQCQVAGKTVSSADVMFAIMEVPAAPH